ncbi:MAG: thermonuclease family protein [Candidatus Nanoarchaeia archaeon]|jgi:endonuclease YncB( thermonuclease family)|nr:thermonuclease family protein [Candidatus Nanoarchaeia archaeon]
MRKILLIFVLSFYVFAEGPKTYGNAKITVTSIYDGDTFRGTITDYPKIIGERIGIRIYGIDCPELKDKDSAVKAKALEAKQFTVAKLREAKVIELRDMLRDKYFRIVAKVFVDGKELGPMLIEKGLAKPYFGGTKEEW